MKILLISNSARGHAIAEAFRRSKHSPEIFAISTTRNPGLEQLCKEEHVGDIMDFVWITQHAESIKPDFAFIAPDDPIGAGLADVLEELGIPSVAPTKRLAQIESSKGFTRELMQKHGIDASPKFRLFTSAFTDEDIYSYMQQELLGNYVVKYDALKSGKGVKVSGEHLQSVDDGVEYARECIEECGQVVVEEKLIGVEFSLMAFVSGTSVVHMPAVQDHKRAFEGDTGPNTGGMGTISDANHSLPFLTNAELAQAKSINQQVAAALMTECGEPYKGILYGGFIATKSGVKVIEYNARFGDPEALNVLPLLESDFVDICLSIIEGPLNEALVRFASKATVCKYITPKGYPERRDEKGMPVKFPAIPTDAHLYFGDINQNSDGSLAINTSRTAGIVGIADSIDAAEKIAESLCEQVTGPVRFRRDIGTAALMEERIAAMRTIRGT